MDIDVGDLDASGANIDAAIKKLVKAGLIPIITPEEMNLHLKEREKAFRAS
jgi:hypothetical protein